MFLAREKGVVAYCSSLAGSAAKLSPAKRDGSVVLKHRGRAAARDVCIVIIIRISNKHTSCRFRVIFYFRMTIIHRSFHLDPIIFQFSHYRFHDRYSNLYFLIYYLNYIIILTITFFCRYLRD